MKGLLNISILILSLSVRAAVFHDLKLKDNSRVKGELIEVYEDRWFYQEQNKTTQKFVLLYNEKNKEPYFEFHNINKISKVKVTKFSKSKYKKYLKRNNLIFKNKLVKNAAVLTGNEGHHKHEKMYGNFAWDIGILNEEGSQFKNSGNVLEDFFIFDQDVVSPLEGTVVGKVSDQEDNAPDLSFQSSLEGKVNNYLTIHLTGPFYLSIVHFKKDSIKVNIGDKVKVGDFLGTVGNSGVSYLPHLHYTLYIYVKEHDRFISVPGFF